VKRRRALGVAALLFLAAIAGCGGSRATEPPPGTSFVPARPAAAFSFESLDTRPVSSAAFAGKPVVLAFIATWDLLSQAQVRFLDQMSKHDVDKVSYVAVFLQETKDRELIEVYRSTLNVTFPMAIADRGTLAGTGPFGDVHTVPTVVVLDGSGNVRFQKVGLAKTEEIRAALRGI
jgi:thiol-disulfide isomerase/thioredoxin